MLIKFCSDELHILYVIIIIHVNFYNVEIKWFYLNSVMEKNTFKIIQNTFINT